MSEPGFVVREPSVGVGERWSNVREHRVGFAVTGRRLRQNQVIDCWERGCHVRTEREARKETGRENTCSGADADETSALPGIAGLVDCRIAWLGKQACGF